MKDNQTKMKKIFNKRLKILELTNFSAGICGVWQRVKQESEFLVKKHEVMVFSSNATKGSNEFALREENLGRVKILRFSFKKLGGESFMSWFNKEAENEALKFCPDIIICHSFRHPHTTKALKIRDKLIKQRKKCKVFLVTHAPFMEKNISRSFISDLVVNSYDLFIAPKSLNKFDKVITITHWEEAYLNKLGINKDKIAYIPNGIPKEFFNTRNLVKKPRGILFLGRVAIIKNLEILIKAIKILRNKSLHNRKYEINLEIIGPVEEPYGAKLTKLIKQLDLDDKSKIVEFLPPIYNLKEKIQAYDRYEIFVLPSLRESHPQSLIEAMARGKIVISSSNLGGKEIIENEKNGFLFQIGNEKQLAEVIEKAINLSKKEKKKIQEQAKKKAEEFKLNYLIKKLERLF